MTELGGNFAATLSMKGHHGQRGELPEIRTDRDTITFVMTISVKGAAPKLVLRCERDGEIYASIDVAGANGRPPSP